MTDYSALSLHELKEAVASAYRRVNELEELHATFADASHAFGAMGDDMNGAWMLATFGWQGQAAQAAGAAVDRNIVYYGEAHDAAHASATATRRLIAATKEHHERTQQINDVDTSYSASLAASGHNPFAAMGEHQRRIDQANANHEQAVQEARALDHSGHTHSTTIRRASWPKIHSDNHDDPPPRTLPTPPPTTTPPTQPPTYPTQPRQPTPRPTPTPRVPTIGTSRGADPAVQSTTPAGLFAPPIPGAGSGPVAAAPGSGAVGGVPDAGLLGSIGGGALAGGALAGGAADGGLGTGDGARVGARPGEAVPNEVAPNEQGAAARGGALAEGGASERGLFGPMGAPMGRRRDDEEHDLPEYLDDADDPWGGAGLHGVTPVIGE